MLKKGQKEGRRYEKYLVLAFLAISIIIYLSFAVQTKSLPYFDELGKLNNLSSQTVEKLKTSYETPEGEVFLDSIDSYYFYHNAMLLEQGNFTLTREPLLSFLEFSAHRVSQAFSRDSTLLSAIFYLPLIFGVISIVLVFFIAKKIMNLYAGFFASLAFAVNPGLIAIFKGGFGDTNPLNIMLSLLFVFLLFCLIEAIKAKSVKNAAIFSSLSAASLLLFWSAWAGWYYMAVIAAVFCWAYFIFYFLKRKEKTKALLLFVIPIVIGISVFAVLGENALPHQLRNYFLNSRFQGIRELKAPGFGGLISSVGGWLMFFVSIFSVLLVLYKTRLFTRQDSEHLLFSFIWLVAMAAVFSTAMRFAAFFAVPLCLIQGAGISAIFGGIKTMRPKIFSGRNAAIWSAVLIAAIASLVLFPTLPLTMKEVIVVPQMDSSVYFSAQKINEIAAPDAMVVSWWDEGHFYKAFAERDVFQRGNPQKRKTELTAQMFAYDENRSSDILEKEICKGRECFVVISSWFRKFYSNQLFEDAGMNTSKAPVFRAFDDCSVDKNNSLIACGKNYYFDLKNRKAYSKGGVKISSLMGNATDMFLDDEQTDYTLIIYNEGKALKSAVARTDLLGSVVIRMFFLQGYGLKNFKMVYSYSNPFKTTIVYEFTPQK